MSISLISATSLRGLRVGGKDSLRVFFVFDVGESMMKGFGRFLIHSSNSSSDLLDPVVTSRHGIRNDSSAYFCLERKRH